jgi:RimJ/RimL family protein N-acetyltransferase
VRPVNWRPGFPEAFISTRRLDIREFGPADEGLVNEVMDRGEWLPLSTALLTVRQNDGTVIPADVEWWLAEAVQEPRRDGTGLNLMILDREACRIAGWIYLTDVDRYARSAEIGYGVRPAARGKGLATEALTAVSRWALSTGGLQRAWLRVSVGNAASMRVAQKAGFRQEGLLRRATLEEDGLHDVAVFALLDDEA